MRWKHEATLSCMYHIAHLEGRAWALGTAGVNGVVETFSNGSKSPSTLESCQPKEWKWKHLALSVAPFVVKFGLPLKSVA